MQVKNMTLKVAFLCATLLAMGAWKFGWFGPNTYEECVSDFIKTSKNVDNNLAVELCRTQFPKLKKLANKDNVKLACEDVLGKWVYSIEVKNGAVQVKETGDVDFVTTSFTKEGITFNGDSEDVKDKRKIKIYGKVDAISSNGKITVEYNDKKTNDFLYEFTCVESN